MAQYFDKNTNEKLPNGDVSSKMTAMNKELAFIKEKGTTEGLTLADKAHYLAVARELMDAMDYYCKLWSKEIADQSESFEFKDLGIKVSPKMGGSLSKIANAVLKELTDEEIQKAVTVSEKALKDIGRPELIEKYKVITGSRANSVSYKELV